MTNKIKPPLFVYPSMSSPLAPGGRPSDNGHSSLLHLSLLPPEGRVLSSGRREFFLANYPEGLGFGPRPVPVLSGPLSPHLQGWWSQSLCLFPFCLLDPRHLTQGWLRSVSKRNMSMNQRLDLLGCFFCFRCEGAEGREVRSRPLNTPNPSSQTRGKRGKEWEWRGGRALSPVPSPVTKCPLRARRRPGGGWHGMEGSM